MAANTCYEGLTYLPERKGGGNLVAAFAFSVCTLYIQATTYSLETELVARIVARCVGVSKVSIYRMLESTERATLEIANIYSTLPSHCMWLFSCYKPVKPPSLVQYGNCQTRSVVSTSIKHSVIPIVQSALCFK